MIATLILALAGCNGPGPGFDEVEATRIAVGPSRFDVRVKGARAEAIRLNPEPAPRLAAVAPRGVAAIEKVSGCRVRRLEGDAALMRAWLDCGGRLEPLPRAIEFECELDLIYDSFADMTCEAIAPRR